MIAQQEMFNCTNFVFSSHSATHLCAKARQSPQERLCSMQDPGIVTADDVILFRGPAEDGYPFLSEEEQVSMKVLVAGRAHKRPWLQKGEMFLNQDDFLAFSHRLNVMTYQALEDLGQKEGSETNEQPAVLVLAACGLADAEYRQPRGGIAQALKTWRTMWSGYFEAVVVACGDYETAAMIDRLVNTDVYMKVLQNLPVSPAASQWHWKLELMQLSYNPVFANIARRMAAMREAPVVSTSASLRADQPKKTGRRASGAGIMFLTEAVGRRTGPRDLTSRDVRCAAAAAVLRSTRRWATGKRVRLHHLRSGQRFEFLVERRSGAVLLSTPRAPFQRLGLPSRLPEDSEGSAELEVSSAMGSEKDWPLFWKVESFEINGALCSKMQTPAMPPGTAPTARSPRAQKATLSEGELRSFARHGVLVLPQAVPCDLWQPACALVHTSLGRPGAIIDGGFDCMGTLTLIATIQRRCNDVKSHCAFLSHYCQKCLVPKDCSWMTSLGIQILWQKLEGLLVKAAG
eukprot:symbB.v1.2.004970.t4/scaffold284.1/size240047/10